MVAALEKWRKPTLFDSGSIFGLLELASKTGLISSSTKKKLEKQRDEKKFFVFSKRVIIEVVAKSIRTHRRHIKCHCVDF